MPIQEEHTWSLAPEDKRTLDTTDPRCNTDLTLAQDGPAAPRSQSSLRQHRLKSQKEMHLFNISNLFCCVYFIQETSTKPQLIDNEHIVDSFPSAFSSEQHVYIFKFVLLLFTCDVCFHKAGRIL